MEQKNENSILEENIKGFNKSLSEDFKKHNQSLLEDFKRHTSVLAEEFKGEVKIVAEQYTNLSGKVDLLIDDMDQVKSDIVDIKTEIKFINKKLDSKVDKEVTDGHEKRIFKLEKAKLAIN